MYRSSTGYVPPFCHFHPQSQGLGTVSIESVLQIDKRAAESSLLFRATHDADAAAAAATLTSSFLRSDTLVGQLSSHDRPS